MDRGLVEDRAARPFGEGRLEEALHRYGVIREAAEERLSPGERGVLVRVAAGRLHRHPSGELREHGRSTIDRWIRAWRAGGFEALKPAVRQVGPLTDPLLLRRAGELRREVPERTGAQIAEILRAAYGERAPSARTVQRELARAGLRRSDLTGEIVGLGRFEAVACNDLWVADALHGPLVWLERGSALRRKAICFAILDDHSRLCVGARFEPAETELRLERTLRAALTSRGLPARLYVDNGAPFASAELARACAQLGIRLVHSRPGRPEGRGKIERFFRTLRDQFLVEAERIEDLSLPELNRLLRAWIERVYHRRAHSETGQAPAARFAGGEAPRYASARELREAFLWSARRVVTKVATVSLHGNRYEVDPVLRGRTIELVYDPYAIGRVEVRWHGQSFGEASAHEIARHVHPRAGADLHDEPPPKTGIDYLALIEAEHERSLARRIAYRKITPDDPGEDPNPSETDTPHQQTAR
jgi:putative transposase